MRPESSEGSLAARLARTLLPNAAPMHLRCARPLPQK
jgi:hypothetical protein